MTNRNTTQLKNLKSKLHSHKMSVLIGAGFSKNVDLKFLSWDELLKDIVLFLYGNEIEDKYILYKPKLKKDEFIKSEIRKIIEKEGYLEIVSQYIKRKGIREAIEIYIENHTPQLSKDGNNLFLQGFIDGKQYKESIALNSLSLHKKLLELPWNNIYTTNYDNLLEFNIDNKIQCKINETIKEIQKDLDDLYKQQDKSHEDNSRLDSDISVLDAKLLLFRDKKKNRIDSALSISMSPDEEDNLLKEKVEKQKEKKNINFNCFLITKSIASKEAEVLKFEKELSHCITTITHSSDLQIKRNKNIIKLHGSLRSSVDEFGFDGENQKHYIIAKEDYDTYSINHEAFTQLMRISLLQESYCLIGFSGTDPNFRSWMSWVRDIIERKKTQKQEYKIYLIEVKESRRSENEQFEESLYFGNHRIVKISLWEKNIIDFLQSETNNTEEIDHNNPKELLKLLFHYLSNEECIYEPQAFIELSEQKRYNDAWKYILVQNNNNGYQFKSTSKNQDIIQFKDRVRIPSIDWTDFHSKKTFLFYISDFLKKSKPKERMKILNILSIAMRDSFLTPYFMWENGLADIFQYITQKKQKIEFSLFNLRESVLLADSNGFKTAYEIVKKDLTKKDDLIYNSILCTAFTFDFTSMKEQVKSWNPAQSSLWMVKKIGILALFDYEKAEELMIKFCYHFDNFNFQEQLFALETLNYIQRNNYIMQSKNTVYDRIKQYKNLGFKSLMDNFDYIAKEITKDENKGKIKPYGEGRFTINNSFNFSNDSTLPQYGLQFIQLLIEFGIPLSLPNIHIKDADTWYSIANQVYKYRPYPVAYYSLQIGNEKILRRIAQEYAYCDELKDDICDILDKLLTAYLNNVTPNFIRKNILIFASELFIAVSPQKWQNHFHKIWKFLEKDHSLFFENINRLHTDVFSFIIKGLIYINDVNIIRKIIASIIGNFDKGPNTTIEYLYYFNNNSIKHKLGRKISNRSIDNKISDLILRISPKNESIISVLGNLHQLLTKTHKQKIEEAIDKLDFTTIQNEKIWYTLLFFAKSEPIRTELKKGIIQNDKLWYTGISKDGSISNQYSPLQLHILNKKYSKNEGIEWNVNECEAIFDKLKVHFDDIKKVRQAHSKEGLISFKYILEEMNYFLVMEKSKLKNISDYKTTYEDVRELYNQERGFETICSALLSADHSIIVFALSELFYDIYYLSGIAQNIEEINLLISKVLMKKEPALEACIIYLSNLLKHRKDDKTLRKFSLSFSMILEEYNIEEPNIEKPFLHENMIQIAEILKNWNTTYYGIDKWMEIKKKNHFNNVSKT